jgi:Tol biopolymer transport system component
MSIGRGDRSQESNETRRWGLVGSKLAAATTTLAAALALVAIASASDPTGTPLEDGRIAVVSEFHTSEIYIADSSGKNQRRLTNDRLGSRWPTVSPDGRRLAFSRKEADGWSVYVRDLAGGPLFDVTAAAGYAGGLSGYADWSPDGTKIAFSQELPDGSCHVVVYDFQSGTALDLTPFGAINLRPRWSPDGSKLAYASNATGDRDIYTVNADGSGRARLTSQPGWEIEPTWSPDGKRLAYVAYPYGKADVFVMNADGTGVRDVTNDPAANDFQPAWSPAGITFSSDRKSQHVYVVQPDGRNRRQVTSGWFENLDPRWAPGNRIVFSSTRHARSEIGVVAGSAYRSLTPGPWLDASPAWSRDGRRLAFSRSSRPGNSDIWVAAADGKQQRNLTRGRGINFGPTWSPKADTIAFVRFEGFGAQIWTMRPDGTRLRALTSVGAWNEHPSWSPDGRRIVFSARRNGNTDLYVIDVQTRRERRLTRTPGEETDPAWSPDGRRIAFVGPSRSGFAAIYVLQLVDPDQQEGVSEGVGHKTDPTWSPNGNRVLYEQEYFLGHDFDIAYETLDGSGVHGPVSGFPWSEHHPAWQPGT